MTTFELAVSCSRLYEADLVEKDLYQSAQLGVLDVSAGVAFRQAGLTTKVLSWARPLTAHALRSEWSREKGHWLRPTIGWPAGWALQSSGVAVWASW